MKATTKMLTLAVLGAGLIAGVIVLAMWLTGGSERAAQASPDPDAVIVGFDMNVAGNSCPGDGSDCTLGTIEACVEVTTGGGVVMFDVFLDDLPSADSILGFGYTFGEKTSTDLGLITACTHLDPLVNLTEQPGSSTMDMGDECDGTVSVPGFYASVGDMGDAEYNPPYTKGVLGRYTLNTTGVGDGVYGLTLSNVIAGNDGSNDLCFLYGCDIWDADYFGAAGYYGLIAIGQACPDYADVEIVSQAVKASDCTSPPPTSMNLGVDKVVCLSKSIVNNGPESPVDVSIATTLSQVDGTDCSIAPVAGNPTSEAGLTDTPVTVDEKFTINCTEPCAHSFSFENVIAVTTGDVIDPDDTNNSMTTPYSADVLAEADLEAGTVTVTTDPTPEAAVGELIDVTVSVDVINNGPWGPVNGDVTFDLTVPGDCTPTPTQQTVEDVSLPVATTAVSYTWEDISCTSTGPHSLGGSATVALDDPTGHTTDDVTGNEDSTGSGTITITSAADVQVLSWDFPDDMTGIPGYQVRVVPGTGVDRTIDSTEVLHNDGPYTPVHVDVDVSVIDADMDGGGVDCDIEPNSPATWQPTLPDSTNVQDVEQFTIDWLDDPKPPYSCTFTFNKTITITDADVGDPTPESPTRQVEAIRDTDGDTVVDRYATGDEDGAGLGSCNDGLDNGPDGDTDIDDADCTLEEQDNCQDDVNPGQEDVDEDGIGDVCDDDNDNDGILDDGDDSGDPFDNPCEPGETVGCDDNCRLIPNGEDEDNQADEDLDGIGNVCELDVDCSGGGPDITDALMILHYIVGWADLSPDQCPPPAGYLYGPRASAYVAYPGGGSIIDALMVLHCIVDYHNIVCPE